MIATYALCGFSNIGSIGIQLGIMTGMCPEKSAVFARVAVRGLLAGSMSCFITACVAGL
jgi:nucleoside permease NupC